MKKFIYKNIIFLLSLILFFGIQATINYFIYSNHRDNIKTNVLILGDSHPQKSVNPKLFNNSLNISQYAEPYILTFWKLKNILKNSKIDTVMIGFAHHNISAFNDLKFQDKGWSTEMFKRIYPIQEFKTITSVEIDYLEFYKILWKQICLFPKLNHTNYIGNYSNSNYSNISNAQSAVHNHYYYEGKEIGVSKIAISYLDSLINICTIRGVKPILISNPVHKTYYKKIPSINISAFEELKTELISKGVMVIDKTKENYPDSLFLDVNHLNESGANRFTKEIKEIFTSRSSESR